MVGEQARVGTATVWLGEFLVENQESILNVLKSGEQSQRK
jgi:hypothetical protein